MSLRPTHATPAGRLFLALRKRAQREGRGTDELLQMHALEAFVYRLSLSPYAPGFALKGGVLLAAYDVRRPTRDVDLSARGLSNALEAVQQVLGEVAALPCPDGWEMRVTGAESIREDATYHGVRVGILAQLASAHQTFHVDVSFGDPVVPAPADVTLERLLGGRITLPGYCALHGVRGEANDGGAAWHREHPVARLLGRVRLVALASRRRRLARAVARRGVTRARRGDARSLRSDSGLCRACAGPVDVVAAQAGSCWTCAR